MTGARRIAARCRRTALGSEGATIVELAISCGILLSLMIGVMQMCFAFYTCHATAYLARQGSRWAMVRGSTSCTNTQNLTDCNATSSEIQSYVTGLGYLNISTSDVTVNWLTASAAPPTTWSACAGTCNTPGNAVQVVVTYPFPLHIPFVRAQTLSVTSRSQVAIAQ